jgi:glycosyltransferase involved in cell wall biosynthesis
VKILYIITKSNWGGAQRHVYDLAIAAKKHGQEVVVALGGEGILRDRLREAGITTRSIGSMKRDINFSGDSASLLDIFKIIREVKPEILHLHSPKAAGLGSLAGRILGVKKIIYTVHGWAFNEDRPHYQKALIAFFSWLTMLFSTHVIMISEKELGQAQAFPLVRQKLRMTRLGIHPPTFFATSSAQHFFQTKAQEPLGKKFIIGTIAELHPNKGLIYAINALEKLKAVHPNFIYFIISEGEQRTLLENMIKEKGLENHIKLIGFVPHAAEYLKGLNLFLLPSVKEGVPYTLLEAGFAGVPVVSTTVGGIPELIEDMQTGVLVQPKKSEELFHAIEFLIEHKGTLREYARNFQERVRTHFNLDQMIQATFKIYSETPRTAPTSRTTPR